MSRDPGLYADVPEDDYHGDKDSLSVSGAKKLLPPSCPAIFKWQRDNGQPPKREFDFGHAAHAQVLGVGAEIVQIDAKDWRTKAAKEEADAARAGGKTPLLAHEAGVVYQMASALWRNPIAAALLDPEHGKAEQSGYWHDTDHDVTRRFRLDWLPDPQPDGRLIVPDYKTCASAEPGAIRKAVANYGYHQQHAWYVDGIHALDLADEPAFVFIFQEKTAPYLVTVVELDTDAVRIGRALNDRALQVYAECAATDTWPSYTSDVELISLPGWATYNFQENVA